MLTMANRRGLEIKRSIIKSLAHGALSLHALERKARTGSQSIALHCKELAFLGVLRLERHERHPKTGRPYTTATLTKLGRALLQK
jgi:hypothetical protein